MTSVIGIDPSLTATGIATPLGVHTIRSQGHNDDTLTERRERLRHIASEVVRIVGEDTNHDEDGRDLVVIEAPAYASKTGKNHDRSGLWWAIVDRLLLGPWIDVVEVTTNQRMRYATGKGQADKDEVLAATIRRFPAIAVANNNEADALILRAMGCDAVGDPLATMPQAHRAKLHEIHWPSWAPLGRPA